MSPPEAALTPHTHIGLGFRLYNRKRMSLSPHFPYVHLDEPAKGKAEGTTVYITDVSIRGIQVLHQRELGTDNPTIRFEWDGTRIEGKGRPLSSRPVERQSTKGVQHLTSTQFELEEMTPESEAAMQKLVEYHVERALDEQLSNARGIPVVGTRTYQAGAAAHGYRRWTLNDDSTWTSENTKDRTQPEEGFTVSLDERDDEVERLRELYVESDVAQRRLIRRLAELSLSERAGVPTRRYTP